MSRISRFSLQHLPLKISRAGTALIYGAAGGFFYFYSFLDYSNLSISKTIFIFAYLTLVFAGLAYFILFRFALPRLFRMGYTKLASALLLAGMILFGCFLTVAIPVDVPQKITESVLKITATGDKNAIANGAEVRLASFQRDQLPVAFGEFQNASAMWKEADGQLMDLANFPAEIVWKGIVIKSVDLVFVSHPWSGKVKIDLDGVVQEIDLFSSESTVKNISLPPVHPQSATFKALFLVATGIVFSLLLFFVLVWGAGFRQNHISQNDLKKSMRWSLLAIIPFAVWTLYLLTYWPGLMSSDFFDQWSQVLNFQFYNAHPAFHTISLWIISRLLFSPGTVALFQIFSLSLVMGYIFKRLYELGINKIVLLILSLLLAFAPVNITLSMTIVKDVPYSIAYLWFCWQIVEILISRGEWMANRKNVLLLAVSSAFVSLFRHNGWPIIIAIVLVLFILYREKYKSFIAFGLIFVLLLGLAKGPLYKIFRVNTTNPIKGASLPYFLAPYIGAHLKANTYLTEDENAFLDHVLDTDQDWFYNPYTTVPMIFSQSLDTTFLEKNSDQIVDLFLKLTIRNPKITFEHFLDMSNMIWQVRLLPGEIGHTVVFALLPDGTVKTSVPDPYGTGLKPNSKIPQLTYPLAFYVQTLTDNSYVFLWRPALQLYILLFLNLVYAVRCRNIRLMLISLPIIVHIAMWMLIITSPDYRYQYPIFLTASLLSPFLLFSGKDALEMS